MTTKTCKVCLKEKERDDFPKAGRMCKDCCVDWQREHRRKTRELFLAAYPPQPKPVFTHKVCTMCSEDKPIEQFNWSNKAKGVRSTYCKPCQGKRSYADALRRGGIEEQSLKYRCNQFGTTVEWYKSTYESQKGLCALCGRPETHPVTKGGKVRRLAIDHDHETGTVRVLLCFRCNTSLRQLELNGLDWAERAVAYLQKHQ